MSGFVKECEWDDVSECVLITVGFPTTPDVKDFAMAIGIEEAKELRNALSKAINKKEKSK